MLVSRQRDYLIGSTEKGMQLVRDNKNYAVIGGRETFYYDIKRFGKTQECLHILHVFMCFIYLYAWQTFVVYNSFQYTKSTIKRNENYTRGRYIKNAQYVHAKIIGWFSYLSLRRSKAFYRYIYFLRNILNCGEFVFSLHTCLSFQIISYIQFRV